MIGILILSLLAGLFFLWLVVRESVRMYRLYRHGLNATGHVINCVRTVPFGAKFAHPDHWSTIKFTDHKGEHVKFTEKKQLPVDQLVPVVYLPNNPRCAQVAIASVRWGELAFITTLLLLCVLCFAVSIHAIFSLIHFRANS